MCETSLYNEGNTVPKRFVAHHALLGAALCLLSAACGSKGSIALSASIQKPRVAVESATLGTRLTGGFELTLEVGPEASESSTVSLESFALVSAQDQATLVAPLPAAPEGASFPLVVGKGELKTIRFVIAGDDPISDTQRGAICAGPVRISGAVSDTLSGGRTTPLTSAAVTAEGC
jgi:hypothetical protein